jgi:hypothetical protein
VWQVLLMTKADANDRARVEFFRLGTSYLVVGRFAALTALFPIAGNLLHHAIEMYLKGALVRMVGLDGLRDIGHNLNRLWEEFKTQIPSAEAGSFDGSIAELHRFELIRYPDRVVREGMEASFTVFRGQRVESSGSIPLPAYKLVLEDIDALTKFLFDKAGVNPQFHLQSLKKESKEFLARHNRHSLE